jgi:hypothetical protein
MAFVWVLDGEDNLQIWKETANTLTKKVKTVYKG